MGTGDCLLERRTRTFPMGKSAQALLSSTEVEIKGWESPGRAPWAPWGKSQAAGSCVSRKKSLDWRSPRRAETALCLVEVLQPEL